MEKKSLTSFLSMVSALARICLNHASEDIKKKPRDRSVVPAR